MTDSSSHRACIAATGTDDAQPYSVYHDVSAMAPGTMLEYRVVLKDSSGNFSAKSSYAVVGAPGAKMAKPGTSTRSDRRGPSAIASVNAVGPVTQPDAVAVAGSLDSELGCTGENDGDWQPYCDQAQMTLDPSDQIWKLTVTIPAGDYHGRQSGHVLLRPLDALDHQRRQRAHHHGPGEHAERVGLPGRLAAGLHEPLAAGS